MHTITIPLSLAVNIANGSLSGDQLPADLSTLRQLIADGAGPLLDEDAASVAMDSILTNEAHARAKLEDEIAALRDQVSVLTAARDGAAEGYRATIAEIGAERDALRDQLASYGKVMLDVIPGPDGEGVEIYTKSAADIENALTKCYGKLDDEEQRRFKAEHERDALRARVAELTAAVQANHEWHLNYDEFGGYPESELCETNCAAGAKDPGGIEAKSVLPSDRYTPGRICALEQREAAARGLLRRASGYVPDEDTLGVEITVYLAGTNPPASDAKEAGK